MTTPDITRFLEELYALEPSLQAQEAELRPLLADLLAARPDAEPDPAFVAHLRTMLRDRAAAPARSAHLPFFSFSPFSTALAGTALGVLVTAPITWAVLQPQDAMPTDTTEDTSLSALFHYSVNDAGEEAFGALQPHPATASFGRGGGGGGEPAPSAAGTAAMDARMMIDPGPGEITQYRYLYDGALPALTDETVDVLKRQPGISGADARDILGQFRLGAADMTSFEGLRVDSLQFYQDREYGYAVHANLREGSLSISSYWPRWPNPAAECRDDACYERLRLSIDDVPADEELLAIAEAFVARHGIDVTRYGSPTVDNGWRTQYERTANKSEFYIPDTQRVIYPLLIDDQQVYEQGGEPSGISVSINVRARRVSDVWGIQNQSYLRSAYAAVTDEAVIRDFLTGYDQTPAAFLPRDIDVKTVDVRLGAPTRGLMRMYAPDGTLPQELYVPALVFPVEQPAGEEFFWRTHVTVPLAADLLESAPLPGGPPMPIDTLPMPLMQEEMLREEDE